MARSQVVLFRRKLARERPKLKRFEAEYAEALEAVELARLAMNTPIGDNVLPWDCERERLQRQIDFTEANNEAVALGLKVKRQRVVVGDLLNELDVRRHLG